MTSTKTGPGDLGRPPKPQTDVPRDADALPDVDDMSSGDPEDASLQDWIEAEHSRPTLPDETADGLDDLDEEVRHQAEDLPLDTPGRS